MPKYDVTFEPMGPLQTRIMLVIWRNGPATVHDVHSTLNAQPDRPKTLAYTTVLTVLRSLGKKKLLIQNSQGKSHIFTAIITADEYKQEAVRHLHQTLFSGNTRDLIACIARNEDLDLGIRDRLQRLFEGQRESRGQ